METDPNLIYIENDIAIEVTGEIGHAKKVLLFCHGFPGTNRLVKLKEVIAAKPRSICSVEVHYRGDKKSKGKFSFLGSMLDIMSVANYLKHSYNYISLYALGYSMGGFYIANVIESRSGLFDKAILLNPLVNTEGLFSNEILMDGLWIHAKNILSLHEPKYYQREIKTINRTFNPMDIARNIITPVTIVQSASDEILDPRDAKRFYTLLKCKKEYIEIPGAKHDLVGNEEELIKAIFS